MKSITICISTMVLCASSFANAAVTTNVWSAQEKGDGSQETKVHFFSYQDKKTHLPLLDDFNAAKQGPLAQIMESSVNGWSPLPAPYDSALPVFDMNTYAGVAEYGNSGLFAVPFDLDTTGMKSASIEFVFTVDNNLGGIVDNLTVDGLYINGAAVFGTTYAALYPDTGYIVDRTIFRDNIAPYLMNGENWLFMMVRDYLPHAGIVFGSTITVTTNPEPATVVMWSALGLCGAVVVTWRRRRHVG